MFVIGSLCVGGAERQTVTLANGLDSLGFEAGIGYLVPKTDLRRDLDARVDARSWCLEKQSGFDVGVLRRLRRAVLEQRPGVIVCVNTYPLLVVDLVLRTIVHRPRLVEVLHSTILVAGWQERSVRVWLRSVINRRCDAVVFVSEDQRAHWQRSYGIAGGVGTVIRNGVDTDYYRAGMAPEARIAERARWGLAASDVVVGCCAAMRPEKRHTDLLDALRMLAGRGLPVKALLIGDGPERDNVERWLREQGFQGSCVITGFQADVRAALEACDIIVLSSATEGSPMSLLEAMALGKPVVAPRVGGIPEQIHPGSNGHMYPPGDVAGLAEAIRRTVVGDRAGAMGDAARRVVCDRFSAHSMVESYAAILGELVGRV